MFILFYLTRRCSLSRTHVNIWLRANQRKTRTQNHQNLTTVLLRLSKYWQILHRSATTSLQNAARNVKAENRRETAQSSWVCQVYRRENLSFMLLPPHSPHTILIIDAYHPNRNQYLNNSNAHAIKAIPGRVRIGNNAIQLQYRRWNLED